MIFLEFIPQAVNLWKDISFRAMLNICGINWLNLSAGKPKSATLLKLNKLYMYFEYAINTKSSEYICVVFKCVPK